MAVVRAPELVVLDQGPERGQAERAGPGWIDAGNAGYAGTEAEQPGEDFGGSDAGPGGPGGPGEASDVAPGRMLDSRRARPGGRSPEEEEALAWDRARWGFGRGPGTGDSRKAQRGPEAWAPARARVLMALRVGLRLGLVERLEWTRPTGRSPAAWAVTSDVAGSFRIWVFCRIWMAQVRRNYVSVV